jgi:sirohydrochlorin ferrochelatase
VRDHAASGLETFVLAFLEFAQPDIGAGVDYCAKLAAKKITVVPYIKPD